MKHGDDDHDGDSYNDQSGWIHNSVQARNIYGGVHHHSPGSDTGVVVYFHPVAISALAAALFLISSAYAHVILNLDLTLWEWFKLFASSLLVVPALWATEYTFHIDVFVALRLLLTVMIVITAFAYGTDVPLTRGISEFLGNWLVWRF